MQKVITISQINEYIKAKMDRDPILSRIAVKGEISNFKVYQAGHLYFTLKDESAAIRCVMFAGNARSLRFRPDNGMKVIATGKVTVFPRDGAYQLYADTMIPDGVGDLHVAFEQLKAKLAAQGLFDEAHKKPIPKYPGIIGIVTSPSGAAIHDMIRVIRKRYPLTKVLLLPVSVQGETAPGQITAAIRYANKYRIADLLIVGRGGGSIEDLWAFNDERVAYAIYQSDIPIISAVGHEPDVTIADYVADLRAATPSNGAELAVPDQDALRQILDSYAGSMASALGKQIKMADRHLKSLADSRVLQSPDNYLESKSIYLQTLCDKLYSAQEKALLRKRQSFVGLTAKLEAMNPMKVLSRGYAAIEGQGGSIIRSVSQVQPGDTILIRVSDGSMCAQIIRKEEKS